MFYQPVIVTEKLFCTAEQYNFQIILRFNFDKIKIKYNLNLNININKNSYKPLMIR